MKIMIDKDAEVGISYTTLNYGKLILDIDSSCAKDIVSSIIEYVGVSPIINALDAKGDISVLDAFSFEDIMNYYGVSQVCEWCEANR